MPTYSKAFSGMLVNFINLTYKEKMTFYRFKAWKTDIHYLVLTHAMTRVEDDPLAHHLVFI